MSHNFRRRSFIQGVIAASTAMTVFCLRQARGGTPHRAIKTVRKNAGSMTAQEIDRFRRAFEYAVSKGFFDNFNDEHYNHHRNRHHGGEVNPPSPWTLTINPITSGYRLLPWHRSFLLEAEQMLRAALRMRNQDDGLDPTEAKLLFIPYWNAADEQDLPQWVLEFQPKGGTAIVAPDLPEGHAGYGKQVGERYNIEFGRWPGQNLVFDTLQTPDYVDRILANTNFPDFYNALDSQLEIVAQNYPKAQAGLSLLESKLPDNSEVQTLNDIFSQPSLSDAVSKAFSDPSSATTTINALFYIGWLANIEAQKAMPDEALIGAVKDVYSLFNFIPHLRMHFWAGGLNPENANVRGTVTYFSELAVDPVFWMLHCELDRYWYTWEKTNKDKPPLQGDDAIFNPLTATEGAWYGGGKTYTLDYLTSHHALPYTYHS